MMMNRLFLKQWARGVDDRTFAMAVAEVGIQSHVRLGWAEGGQYVGQRNVQRFEWLLRHEMVRDLPPVAQLVVAWNERVRQHPQVVLLLSVECGLSDDECLGFAHILQSLDAVAGVTIEQPASTWQRSSSWTLPFTVGMPTGEPAIASLSALNHSYRQHWPIRFFRVNRQRCRPQILLVSSGLSELALRLEQSLPMDAKAFVLIVNGLGRRERHIDWAALQRIAQRLSLSAVVLPSRALTGRQLGWAVTNWVYELTHDSPLDAATKTAFGSRAVFVGHHSVLWQSRISEIAEGIVGRATELAHTNEVVISGESLQSLTHGALPPSAMRSTATAGSWLYRTEVLGLRPDALAVSAPELKIAMQRASVDFHFDSEVMEASALNELADSLRAAASDAAAAGRPRFVQQQMYWVKDSDAQSVRVHKALLVNQLYRMNVRIGDLDDPQWSSSTLRFPEERLPPNESTHRLTVIFHAQGQLDEPLSARIELPPAGPSSTAEFEFVPQRIGAFEGRLVVLHQSRVLQTVLVQTQVVESDNLIPDNATIRLLEETIVRQDWTSLNLRQRFDAALVFNGDATGVEGGVVIARNQPWEPGLQGVTDVAREIGVALTAVANNVQDYNQGLEQGENPVLMLKLASLGQVLVGALLQDRQGHLQPAERDLRSDEFEYIQVVSTRPNEVIPIEFAYDYELDAQYDNDPLVCPEHLAALGIGRCQSTCPGRQSPGRYLCPMGFWGVRKVIERHNFDPQGQPPNGTSLYAQSEFSYRRGRLYPLKGVVVGHSDRVSAADVKSVMDVVAKALDKSIAPARDWSEWAQSVRTSSPQLLLAFPHNVASGPIGRLEIGSSELRTGAIPLAQDIPRTEQQGRPLYVRSSAGGPPLVILLGCDVTGTSEEFASHVDAFRRGGAAVVVSTIATVFGLHAVAVGQAMVQAILQQATKTAGTDDPEVNPVRLGEVLRDIKRQALASSLPMALCVVAFGDADWRM